MGREAKKERRGLGFLSVQATKSKKRGGKHQTFYRKNR